MLYTSSGSSFSMAVRTKLQEHKSLPRHSWFSRGILGFPHVPQLPCAVRPIPSYPPASSRQQFAIRSTLRAPFVPMPHNLLGQFPKSTRRSFAPACFTLVRGLETAHEECFAQSGFAHEIHLENTGVEQYFCHFSASYDETVRGANATEWLNKGCEPVVDLHVRGKK